VGLAIGSFIPWLLLLVLPFLPLSVGQKAIAPEFLLIHQFLGPIQPLMQGHGFFDEMLANALHLAGEVVEIEHGLLVYKC
jgi:hypothetical protein